MKSFSLKNIKGLILYTIVILFAFIYIKDIINILGYIIKLFMPFIIGLGVAFVLNVLVNVVEKKWLKNWKASAMTKRAVSLIVALTMVIGFFVFLLFLIIPNLQNTIAIFADNIPAYTKNLQELLNSLGIETNIINEISEVFKSLGDSASNYIVENSNQVLETTLGIATNVVTGFINVTIGIVFAIYFLAQKEKISGQVDNLMHAYLPEKIIVKIQDIASLSNKIFSNFVGGQCIEAIIIGFLCFLGMLILRLPYASTISVLVGFTALIPVFGAFIGTIIGAFLIFMISPLQALIFIIFILVLQQLEGNLIYPKVVGKSVGLPGIWVLVAVTIGASINGVLGMLLSVPIASIIYSTMATNIRYRLKEKNLGNKKAQV